MNKQQKAKWVKALRSGKYRQGRERLQNGIEYCCMGVANEVLELEIVTSRAYLRDNCGEIIFLPSEIQTELGVMNDEHEMPFDLIAGFIDTFIEPTE